jgi:hypothetical protein
MQQQTAAQPTNHQQHAEYHQQQLAGQMHELCIHKSCAAACRQHQTCTAVQQLCMLFHGGTVEQQNDSRNSLMLYFFAWASFQLHTAQMPYLVIQQQHAALLQHPFSGTA